jgi:SPP1 gp7 family putative phage head morphogenesis protein
VPRKRSKQDLKDPTRSQRKINAYEQALVLLFRNYKQAVLEDLERDQARTLEAPALRPIRIDLKVFSQHLDQLDQDVLLNPAAQTISLQVPPAYRAGVTFASIRLGAPVDMRRDAWKRIGDLVQGNKDAFAKITAETSGRIRATISSGLVNERPFGEVTRDIVRTVDDVGITRATMMARTEIMRGVNAGVKDRYQQAGVEKVEWLAALDNVTCPECEDLNGEVFPIDDTPDCPAHPNCRCTLIPKIEIPQGGSD